MGFVRPFDTTVTVVDAAIAQFPVKVTVSTFPLPAAADGHVPVTPVRLTVAVVGTVKPLGNVIANVSPAVSPPVAVVVKVVVQFGLVPTT